MRPPSGIISRALPTRLEKTRSMRLRSSGSSISSGMRISTSTRCASAEASSDSQPAAATSRSLHTSAPRGAAARDVQQVLQQFLNAPRSAVDVGGQTLHLRRSQVGIHQHLGAAIHRRQRIAQIVHDGTREASDGGDALLTDQLLARLLDGGAHGVEGARQPSELILADHFHPVLVILPGHLGGRAVQFLERLDDPPRQQIGQSQAGGRRPAARAE